jgi:hypothetical protein
VSKKLIWIKGNIQREIKALDRAIGYYQVKNGELASLVRMEDQKEFLQALLGDLNEFEESFLKEFSESFLREFNKEVYGE